MTVRLGFVSEKPSGMTPAHNLLEYCLSKVVHAIDAGLTGVNL